jgi:hypothetical protein
VDPYPYFIEGGEDNFGNDYKDLFQSVEKTESILIEYVTADYTPLADTYISSS